MEVYYLQLWLTIGPTCSVYFSLMYLPCETTDRSTTSAVKGCYYWEPVDTLTNISKKIMLCCFYFNLVIFSWAL